MHITVCWDISAGSDRWTQINNQMKESLKGYSWARPLRTLYVIKVETEDDRQKIKDSLVSVIKSVPEKVHLIVTPAMSGGVYAGWLPKDMWEKINQRTKA